MPSAPGFVIVWERSPAGPPRACQGLRGGPASCLRLLRVVPLAVTGRKASEALPAAGVLDRLAALRRVVGHGLSVERMTERSMDPLRLS